MVSCRHGTWFRALDAAPRLFRGRLASFNFNENRTEHETEQHHSWFSNRILLEDPSETKILIRPATFRKLLLGQLLVACIIFLRFRKI